MEKVSFGVLGDAFSLYSDDIQANFLAVVIFFYPIPSFHVSVRNSFLINILFLLLDGSV